MKTQKASVLTYLLFGAVILQFCTVVFFNYQYANGFLNMDTSMGIRQNLEQWKHGLFLDDFSWATTLSNDYVSFFSTPILLLTNNLGLSMACGQGLLYLVVALILRDICKNLEANINTFLFSILVIFTPYSFDVLDWAYMIFVSVGYWACRMIAMLLLFDLLLLCRQPSVHKVKFAFVFAGSMFMNFWTSLSTGNYIICMIVFPLALAVLWDVIEKQAFSWKAKDFWVIITAFLSCVLGWAYRNINAPGLSGVHNDAILLTADQIFNNMINAFLGVFMLFGGINKSGYTSVFSAFGLLTLIRLAFFVLGMIIVITQCCKKKGSGSLIRAFLCVLLVNMAVLLLTNTSYSEKIFEYRYHLMWCIMFLLVLSSAVMNAPFSNRWLNIALSYGFFAAIVIINLCGFYLMPQNLNDRGYEKAILRVADANDVDTIFVYNNPAIPYNLRAMDINKESIGVTHTAGYAAINTWGYYSAISENNTLDKPNILICQDTQFELLPPYIKDDYTLVDTDTFGNGHNGYYAKTSPWDYQCGMPLASEKCAVDFPYTKGYVYSGIIDDKGCLISDTDDQGYVLCSPNCVSAPGLYTMTVIYDILDPGTDTVAAVMDIAAHNGETSLLSAELPTDQNSFTLENINILSAFQLKFRIWKSNDSVISIQKIIFERVRE